MAHDSGDLLGASVFGFGLGIYVFIKGFREFREYRVVSDTPAIPIRSVPMGWSESTAERKASSR